MNVKTRYQQTHYGDRDSTVLNLLLNPLERASKRAQNQFDKDLVSKSCQEGYNNPTNLLISRDSLTFFFS